MTEFRPAAAPSGARTLPGPLYTSEGAFRADLERVFSRSWVCAGRSEEIPASGDFLNVQLGEESLLLVRGEDGAARAFYNVCRHRGTRLCTEGRGRMAGSIQCPYHGWSYALDGRLVGARHMRDVESFRAEDYPLYSAALQEWEGFLYLNLSPEPEPFEAVFAPVLRRFAPWGLGELRSGARVEYEVRANWKLLVENYSECYHCPLVHPALVRISPADSGRNDLDQGPFLGGYMELNRPEGSMTTTGATHRPPLPGLRPEDRERVYYYALFPNLLLSLHPDYVMTHVLWPIRADLTRIVCEWHFPPAVLQGPGFDPSDAVEFWDRTNREDWRVCELTHAGLRSRAYTPGPYAPSEGLLWAFDRHYLSVLGDESAPGGRD